MAIKGEYKQSGTKISMYFLLAAPKAAGGAGLRMRKLICLAALLAVMAVSLFAQQDALTNESILKLVKSGISEDVVLSVINQQKGTYRTGVDDLVTLKTEGVSDKVIAAMVNKGTMTAPAPSAADASTVGSLAPQTATGMPTEAGVYFKRGDAWIEVFPEVVNWKTGGVTKTVLSAGLIKGDLNGRLAGSSSHTTIKVPTEVLVVAPEGVTITEYQLLRLRPQKEGREFRTVTGGFVHVSGGATRDLVPFDGKRVGPRSFTVMLSSLTPGEFGFLAPTSDNSQKAVSAIGKMYTFRVFE
jgi:hypothetical protein